jgi:hypothetical protein
MIILIAACAAGLWTVLAAARSFLAIKACILIKERSTRYVNITAVILVSGSRKLRLKK